MEAQLQANLEVMMGCLIGDMPDSLVERCERAEQLIKQVKPYGGLMSTQVLAVVVVGWESTALSGEKDQVFLTRSEALRREKEESENSSAPD